MQDVVEIEERNEPRPLVGLSAVADDGDDLFARKAVLVQHTLEVARDGVHVARRRLVAEYFAELNSERATVFETGAHDFPPFCDLLISASSCLRATTAASRRGRSQSTNCSRNFSGVVSPRATF